MNLEEILRDKLKEKKLLLMTHMVVGYPSLDDNRKMLDVMSEVGADVVELQFPFSDPVADGPVFQKANQMALDGGMTVDRCFDFMSEAGQRVSMPLLMMGYYNVVYARGEAEFARFLAQAGGKGMILPDLPPENAGSLREEAKSRDLAMVGLISPNTTRERKQEIADQASGCLYCVARKGVTGTKSSFGAEIDDYLREVRSVSKLPLALGFGVGSPAEIRSLQGRADIAVVGTAALKAWEQGGASALKSVFLD